MIEHAIGFCYTSIANSACVSVKVRSTVVLDWMGLLIISDRSACSRMNSVLADPGFLYKLVFDEVLTIGNAVWWEFQHRGER